MADDQAGTVTAQEQQAGQDPFVELARAAQDVSKARTSSQAAEGQSSVADKALLAAQADADAAKKESDAATVDLRSALTRLGDAVKSAIDSL